MTEIVSDDGLVILRPAGFSTILCGHIARAKVRPPRPFSRFITEEIVMPMDGGPFQGKPFRFEYQPISRLWAEEIDSGNWNEFIYTGPSQSGKSFNGYVLPFIWHVAELNESIGFGVPMEEMAGDKWAADLKPVFQASPFLRALLPRSGPGSAGGTIRDRVQFSHGPMAKILTAGGSDQAKAGFTLRTILVTEAARFSRGAEKSQESTPLEQLRARQRATKWIDRRTYIEGTKTVAHELPESLRDQSSNSRIVSPCPHCGAWISPTRKNLLGWEGARTDVEAAELASWFCPVCTEAINTEERRESLSDVRILHGDQKIAKNGTITGDLPKTRRLFFDYGAWHNKFLDAGDIAVDLWSAAQCEINSRAHEKNERKLAQFVFGTAYTEPLEYAGEVLEEADFETRREQLPRGIVHKDTMHTIAAVDVGEKAVHWSVMGVRPNALHIPDYGVEPVPRDAAMKDALRDVLIKLFLKLAVGVVRDGIGDSISARMPLRSIYCDSGHLHEVVFDAAKEANKSLGKQLVLPILGRGQTQMDRRKYTVPTRTGNVVKKIDPERRWHLSRVPRARIDQLTIDVDHYKIIADNSWRTPANAPGAMTLFAAATSVHRVFIKHQINEQWITEELPGEPPKSRWIEQGPQHYKDTVAYNVCGATRLGWATERSAEDKQQQASNWS